MKEAEAALSADETATQHLEEKVIAVKRDYLLHIQYIELEAKPTLISKVSSHSVHISKTVRL